MKQAGIVYGMTDPHERWVKIGCVRVPTVDQLRRRRKGLNPLGNPLLVRRAVRVKDVDKSENMMHAIFERRRIRGTEKFNVEPEEFCPAMYILANGKGHQNLADFIKEVEQEVRQQVRLKDRDQEAWSQYKLISPPGSSSEDSVAGQSDSSVPSAMGKHPRRPNLSLVQLNLKSGDVLTHAKGKSVTATVVDPEEGIVEFNDDNLHISSATKIMQKQAGHTLVVRPYSHWKFEGKLLSDKAEEVYKEMGL